MASPVYTPAQASAISGLSLKSVHKVMEHGLIRPARRRIGRRVQRLLSAEQLVYLRLEAEGARLLPLNTRRKVAKALEREPQADRMFVGEGRSIIIELKAARAIVEHDLKRLQEAVEMAVADPAIMRGTPVFRGTRIPVELVAEMLAQGASAEEILLGYPALTLEKIELAPLYLRAFPRRGRPSWRPWAKNKPTKVTSSTRRLVSTR